MVGNTVRIVYQGSSLLLPGLEFIHKTVVEYNYAESKAFITGELIRSSLMITVTLAVPPRISGP